MDQKLLKEYNDEFNSLTKEIQLNLQELEKLRPFDENWDKLLQNRKSALVIIRKAKINLIKRIELYQEEGSIPEELHEMFSGYIEMEHGAKTTIENIENSDIT